jgi:acetylornithine deacetylase/succinyl-diaminopimelate desuccinylase-like protein
MPAQEKRFPRELVDKAANDIEGRWMLLGAGLSPMLAAPTAPEWLRAAISAKGKELGLEMRASNGMGSDHRIFAQAGVPATNIAISGEGTHTASDVPEAVNTASIEKAAQLVFEVVATAISRAGE